jgi:predicted ArsR family transcriptional regulator
VLPGASGRPASIYHVSPQGEVFFPKQYEALTVRSSDTVLDSTAKRPSTAALARITDREGERVGAAARRKDAAREARPPEELYQEVDEFVSVQLNGDASMSKRNCPFLNVAQSRPRCAAHL